MQGHACAVDMGRARKGFIGRCFVILLYFPTVLTVEIPPFPWKFLFLAIGCFGAVWVAGVLYFAARRERSPIISIALFIVSAILIGEVLGVLLHTLKVF